jgi:hypothetical protein
LLAAFERNRLRAAVAARRDFVNEVMNVYQVQPC